MAQYIECVCRAKTRIPFSNKMAKAYQTWNRWLANPEDRLTALPAYRSLTQLEAAYAKYDAEIHQTEDTRFCGIVRGKKPPLYCIAVHYSQNLSESGRPNSWHLKLVVFCSPDCLNNTKRKIAKSDQAYRQMLKWPALLGNIIIPLNVLGRSMGDSLPSDDTASVSARYFDETTLSQEFGQIPVETAVDSDDEVSHHTTRPSAATETMPLLQNATNAATPQPGKIYHRLIEQTIIGEAGRPWSDWFYDKAPRWQTMAWAAGAAVAGIAGTVAVTRYGLKWDEPSTTMTPPTCPPPHFAPELDTALATCPPSVPARGNCQQPGLLSGYMRNVTYTGAKVLTRADLSSIQYEKCIDQSIPFEQLFKFYVDCTWTGPGKEQLVFLMTTPITSNVTLTQICNLLDQQTAHIQRRSPGHGRRN